jgi:uncharacterized protein YjlB
LLGKGTYRYVGHRATAEPFATIIGHQEDPMKIETLRLEPHEWIPNHPSLPVVIYRSALMPTGVEATAVGFETMFRDQSWPPQWRNGVYGYQHYHSSAHEVLGFASGSACLILGGPGGIETTVNAGDAVLLPAGTGRCRLQASADLLVVGAYPPGQDSGICRSAPSQAMLIRIASPDFPGSDPNHRLRRAVASRFICEAVSTRCCQRIVAPARRPV